ncbi:MAG: type II toxin-antitoxin system PemK/MazF family toxin [Planctomycetota bacterium]|jgi:mRNA interferase MazF
MIKEGKIVLFKFPQTDLGKGKIRPALVVKKLPGKYDDWLICMISSQLENKIDEIDNIINEVDEDYSLSGLKKESLFRVSRLAVADKSIFSGIIGEISQNRLQSIKHNIAEWINSN